MPDFTDPMPRWARIIIWISVKIARRIRIVGGCFQFCTRDAYNSIGGFNESLRAGDFERAIIEWRSLLRHIVWAPDCDWSRWRELKAVAADMLARTESERLSTLTSKKG